MAQSFEVTEKVVNGKTHGTALTKSYNSAYVENFKGVDASGTDDTEVFLKGRATKDLRRVDENYAAVLAAMNAAPTTTIEKSISLTVKAKQGDLEANIVPFLKGFGKSTIVEYFADPNDAADSIVITAEGKNDMERAVWTVDETYAAIKAKFLL
jgi:hypothetical protein